MILVTGAGGFVGGEIIKRCKGGVAAPALRGLSENEVKRIILESGADTLILGCTHYPIIANTIANALPGVTLISSGAEAAKKAVELLGAKPGDAKTSYFVSDDPKMFVSSASLFLGEEIEGSVTKIDIDKY